MQSRWLLRFVSYLFAFGNLNIVSLVNCESSDGVFVSDVYWELNDKPILANGHIGFVPYGESIYMNGLYNGERDKSHRARIPNYGNVQFVPCSQTFNLHSKAEMCSYGLDINNGIFRTQTDISDGHFTVEHIQYPHRYYDIAIVNHIRIKRNTIDHVNEG